jgi:dienelactone hydrolase
MLALDGSDTLIIVIHEIYGINQHISGVCEYFKKAGFDVICPDLLNMGSSFDYDHEEIAYEYFMKNVGFDSAVEKVSDIIIQNRQKYKKIFLVGFSIGATITWLCSGKEPICEGIIGYYGSRIRNYTDVIPKCPALLIFAAEERSFNVMETVDVLRKKTNAKAHVLIGKHGFSDPFSRKYCEKSSKEAMKLAENFFIGK